MFYEQEEVRDLIKDIVIKHRESVPGRHTTSAHLYNLKEGLTPEGHIRIHFFSTGGVLHNCFIAFNISDDGWVTCEHCMDPGMIQLEEIVFNELEQYFRGEGIKTKLEFEDVIYKNRLRGRRRRLRIMDELLLPENLPKEIGENIEKPVETISHDVFVSYSSMDKTVANSIVAYLEKDGIKCWIAPRDVLPGVNFHVAIVNAIKSCKIMVLIYSSRSNRSAHVKSEVNVAFESGAIIIPFRLEDVPLSQEMQYLISTKHWIDAMTPPLEDRINELVSSVSTFLRKEKPKKE